MDKKKYNDDILGWFQDMERYLRSEKRLEDYKDTHRQMYQDMWDNTPIDIRIKHLMIEYIALGGNNNTSKRNRTLFCDALLPLLGERGTDIDEYYIKLLLKQRLLDEVVVKNKPTNATCIPSQTTRSKLRKKRK